MKNSSTGLGVRGPSKGKHTDTKPAKKFKVGKLNPGKIPKKKMGRAD